MATKKTPTATTAIHLTASLTEEQIQQVINFATSLVGTNENPANQPMTKYEIESIIEFLADTKQYTTLQNEQRKLFYREGTIPLDCWFEIKWDIYTNKWIYNNYNDELYDRFYLGDPVKTKDIASFQNLPSKQEQKKLLKEFELKCKKWILSAVSVKFGMTLEESELEDIFLDLFNN